VEADEIDPPSLPGTNDRLTSRAGQGDQSKLPPPMAAATAMRTSGSSYGLEEDWGKTRLPAHWFGKWSEVPPPAPQPRPRCCIQNAPPSLLAGTRRDLLVAWKLPRPKLPSSAPCSVLCLARLPEPRGGREREDNRQSRRWRSQPDAEQGS
jgi:hypothetical protein